MEDNESAPEGPPPPPPPPLDAEVRLSWILELECTDEWGEF